MLTCKLQDVHNDIVYTSEKFGCDFKPHSGDAQSYTGEIKSPRPRSVGHQGHDAGLGRVRADRRRRLAGSAQGALPRRLGGVAVGAGAGANVLVGGGHKSVTLQPISASGIVGAGASADIEEFELR